MSNEEDLKHANEFGEIEAFKETKYWFKRDIETIIRSIKSLPKYITVVFFISLVTSLVFTLFENPSKNYSLALIYLLVLFPIFLLGFLLLHIIMTKGYGIYPESTYISTENLSNRFSLDSKITLILLAIILISAFFVRNLNIIFSKKSTGILFLLTILLIGLPWALFSKKERYNLSQVGGFKDNWLESLPKLVKFILVILIAGLLYFFWFILENK